MAAAITYERPKEEQEQKALAVIQSPQNMMYIYSTLLKLAPEIKSLLNMPSPTTVSDAERSLLTSAAQSIGTSLILYQGHNPEQKQSDIDSFSSSLVNGLSGGDAWRRLSEEKKSVIERKAKELLDDQVKTIFL